MMSKSFHHKAKFKERIYKLRGNDYYKGISTLVGAGILNFLVGAIFPYVHYRFMKFHI